MALKNYRPSGASVSTEHWNPKEIDGETLSRVLFHKNSMPIWDDVGNFCGMAHFIQPSALAHTEEGNIWLGKQGEGEFIWRKAEECSSTSDDLSEITESSSLSTVER